MGELLAYASDISEEIAVSSQIQNEAMAILESGYNTPSIDESED